MDSLGDGLIYSSQNVTIGQANPNSTKLFFQLPLYYWKCNSLAWILFESPAHLDMQIVGSCIYSLITTHRTLLDGMSVLDMSMHFVNV